MKRSKLSNRASRKKLRKRELALETLEPKVVLDASFGFIATPGGFAFQITGTDFQQSDATKLARADNIVLWTDLGVGGRTAATSFFVEWVDNGGTWHSLSGSVTAGDIADEASDRLLQPGDFEGYLVKAMGGNDTVRADGGGAIGTLPGNSVPGADPLGGNGVDIDSVFLGQRLTVDGNSGGDTIYGSPEDDIIRGGPDGDVIHAGNGDDNVIGGAGDDQIWGDGGNDTLTGDDGRDKIFGGDGDDNISGGAGDDGQVKSDGKDDGKHNGWGLFGGNGNDTIDGGDGADDISGDAGSDKLTGGSGADSLLGDNKDKTPDGGSGTDVWQAGPTVDTSDVKKGVKFSTSTIEKVDTTGAAVGEPTHLKGDVKPGDWLKFKVVDPGLNGPFTAAGPFSLNDEINLSGWTTDGTSGVEINTGGGDDVLVGSDAGADILRAGDGNDKAAGLDKQDFIDGGLGDDGISGGGGADEINGGDGFDTLTYAPYLGIPGSPAGVEVSIEGLLDFWHAGDKRGGKIGDSGEDYGRGGDAQGDRIHKEGGTIADQNKKTRGALDSSIEAVQGSEFDDIIYLDLTDNGADGHAGNDKIYGLEGNDTLLGGDGEDLVDGDFQEGEVGKVVIIQPSDFGDDVLRGGKDNDELQGRPGEDQALGEIGDDFVKGGAGHDALSGGKGQDTLNFEYENNEVVDVNEAFLGALFGNEGNDNFQVTGTSSAADEFDVMFELANADQTAYTDFDNNEDDLEFL